MLVVFLLHGDGILIVFENFIPSPYMVFDWIKNWQKLSIDIVNFLGKKQNVCLKYFFDHEIHKITHGIHGNDIRLLATEIASLVVVVQMIWSTESWRLSDKIFPAE